MPHLIPSAAAYRGAVARSSSGQEQKTALEDVEVIRELAVRYGDDEIALVLKRPGRRSGKDKR